MIDRVEELLAELTLDEQASLTAGVDMWHATGVERLGITGIKVTDGPNGARGAFFVGTSSACAPCGTALGATWNTELVSEVGRVLGEETRAKHAQLLLAPTINIHRSPLAGRNFECYSEDPYLTGRLAVAYIEGVQSTGVGCAVKHFAANDSEFERHTISSEVDEQTLREIYLAPFEAAVTEARSASIMAAYNKLNGTYCAEHPELMRILFDEWGFDGFVISDWFGVKSTIGTGLAGCDLEMPGPAAHLGQKLADAVRAGDLPAEAVTAKVRRLLHSYDRLRVDERDVDGEEGSQDRPEHRDVLRRAAREAIVVLRNESATLPIVPADIRRLVVIGPNADAPIVQGGGSAGVTPHHVVTVLDGLRARYERDGVEVSFVQGCDASRTAPPLEARLCGSDGISVDYFAGLEPEGDPVARQHVGSGRMVWLGDPTPAVRAGDFSLRLRAAVTARRSGDHTVALVVGGRGRLSCDGEPLLDMWDEFRPGTSFFGLGSEEIRATVHFDEGQTRVIETEFACFGGLPAAGLLVGLIPPIEGIEAAAEAAASADAAVVVVGLNADWETEGEDRVSMDLPGDQEALIAVVAAACPRTVVLVNAGSPVSMGWVDSVGAAAQIWYPGQESGDAVADVVSGDVSPSGRLPTTFPVRYEDNPAIGNYPGADGVVRYDEGRLVGYRHYDALAVEPRYPFGHGLSYSTFDYGSPVIDGDGVALDITNTGDVAALEVVQLYVAPVAPGDDPIQELKGFRKVHLGAGESTTVRFALDDRSFRHWDVEAHDWRIRPGDYELRIGASSRDIRQRATIGR